MATIKYAFILLFVLATLNSINSQMAVISNSLPQIISLLENTTNISPYMPQLAALLKDQKAEQVSTNQILVNTTASVLGIISLMANTQTRMSNSLTEIQSTQNSIASTQTQMANAMNQMVSLLQRHEQQLENVTATMTAIKKEQNAQNQLLSRAASLLQNQRGTYYYNNNTYIQEGSSFVGNGGFREVTQQITRSDNATNEMVSLLRRHEQQLANVIATMASMTEHQNTQNQILTSLLQIRTERLMPITAQDCTDILDQGFNDNYGTYTIKPPDNLVSFQVSCDLLTEGGGWIVFQRRFDGSVDFYRGWEDYKNGFGELNGEHWLGLEKIHRLTSNRVWQLRIELEDFYGNTAYAQYDNFVIGNETTYYRLGLGAYGGTTGDALTANRAFTTYDHDHDSSSSRNCAELHQGGWWYASCGYSNLNGPYVGSPVTTSRGIVWRRWKNTWEVLKKAEMKIRCTQ